jgi:hypothetical protein
VPVVRSRTTKLISLRAFVCLLDRLPLRDQGHDWQALESHHAHCCHRVASTNLKSMSRCLKSRTSPPASVCHFTFPAVRFPLSFFSVRRTSQFHPPRFVRVKWGATCGDFVIPSPISIDVCAGTHFPSHYELTRQLHCPYRIVSGRASTISALLARGCNRTVERREPTTAYWNRARALPLSLLLLLILSTRVVKLVCAPRAATL